MKKYFMSVLTVVMLQQQVFASTFYDQLCGFNCNWKKYPMQIPVGEARNFATDEDLVFAHLSCVIPILKTNPVDQLSPGQCVMRENLINVLDDYRLARNYPVNYYRHERIPVFIDPNNTHCAVAYLLQHTGYEDLAQRIAVMDNYVWVKDIHDPELLGWQQASGLSLDELKLIQGAYDFYMPDAFILPNRYEIPQKPMAKKVYFEDEQTGVSLAADPVNVWIEGDGVKGMLNGKWVQNWQPGLPWIEGYFENGKRTGQWKEYYQGTLQLCRTEVWRNDKLNGLRKRFDRNGELIEEILFRNGNAICKTNYDLKDSLKWVRKPVDSNHVYTEVYTMHGDLIAFGHETVYNPGNLLWFQNIELTALNTISVSARGVTQGQGMSGGIPNGMNGFENFFSPGHGRRSAMYYSPTLVEYRKQGTWTYYREFSERNYVITKKDPTEDMLHRNYEHFGADLYSGIKKFDDLKATCGYDSVKVKYKDDCMKEFEGFGINDYTHLHIAYHEESTNGIVPGWSYSQLEGWVKGPLVRELGQYNWHQQKTGLWKHFDTDGVLYKTENFIIPKEEELVSSEE